MQIGIEVLIKGDENRKSCSANNQSLVCVNQLLQVAKSDQGLQVSASP